METLEKKEFLNKLFILYRNLFTKKQIECFEMYYFDDFSLQEIGEIASISRSAVFDTLKKVEDKLLEYEDLLKLFFLQEKRRKLIEEFEKSKDLEIIKKLKEMDE